MKWRRIAEGAHAVCSWYHQILDFTFAKALTIVLTLLHLRGRSRIPRRRGTGPPGDANIQFCQYFQKLHEIEKFLDHMRGGTCAGGAPDPPMHVHGPKAKPESYRSKGFYKIKTNVKLIFLRNCKVFFFKNKRKILIRHKYPCSDIKLNSNSHSQSPLEWKVKLIERIFKSQTKVVAVHNTRRWGVNAMMGV